MRQSASIALAAVLGAVAAGLSVPASAALLTINLTAPINDIQLSGEGPVPLGQDIGDAIDDPPGEGYANVNTQVLITESTDAGHDSQVTFGLSIDTVTSIVSVNTSMSLYLDILLTDADASLDFSPDINGGAGGPTVAMEANPLEVFSSVTPPTDEAALLLLIAALQAGDPITLTDIGAIVSAPIITHDLNGDVNGNGLDDIIKFSAGSFVFAGDIDFGEPMLVGTPEELSQALVDAFVNDIDATVDFTMAISISAAEVTFEGDVLDAAVDPHFTTITRGRFGTFASVQAVSAPGTLALALAGAAFAALRRRRR